MLQEYYRLMKPGIIRANVMTAAAGFLFASAGEVAWAKLLYFLLGNALVIACGCILNNIIDRNIDKKMVRTQKRGLVTGRISVTRAGVLATSCAVLGVIVLTIVTNLLTVLIGLWALFFYVVVYGYAKRETGYGTEVGSLPGAASILAGYAAVTNQIDEAGLILFACMIFWQMPHFFSIAIYRSKEYAAAKIPILPLTRGLGATKLRILSYIVGFVICAQLLFAYDFAGKAYAVAMLLAGLYWLARAFSGLNTQQPDKWARQMFGTSLIVLLIFSFAISLDHWLP